MDGYLREEGWKLVLVVAAFGAITAGAGGTVQGLPWQETLELAFGVGLFFGAGVTALLVEWSLIDRYWK